MCNRYGYLAPVSRLPDEFSQIRIPLVFKDGAIPNAPPREHIRPTNHAPIIRPLDPTDPFVGVAVILALIFFGRKYLWPEHHADTMGRAAVAGYSRPPAAQPPDQDDAAIVGSMIDAGRMWAKVHRPNNAVACPSFPIPFHRGCVAAVAGTP